VVGKGVINSPKIENRTFAHNAAKQEKEPIITNAARRMNDRFKRSIWV
tara:strand:- start:1058 stop:1201 length:144 start_codon:yes stop_codon:yes gene_type:complete